MRFMKLVVANLENLHFLLNNPPNLGTDESGPLKYRGGETNRERSFSYGLKPVMLPSPLSIAGATFEISGDFYNAVIPIYARNGRVFPGISKKLSKRFGDFWYPLSRRGGYLFDDVKDAPAFAVVTLNRDASSLGIFMGVAGARPRVLGNEDNFKMEIGALESVTNIILNYCLDSPSKEQNSLGVNGENAGKLGQRGRGRDIKDLTLYLTF